MSSGYQDSPHCLAKLCTWLAAVRAADPVRTMLGSSKVHPVSEESAHAQTHPGFAENGRSTNQTAETPRTNTGTHSSVDQTIIERPDSYTVPSYCPNDSDNDHHLREFARSYIVEDIIKPSILRLQSDNT